MTPHNLPLPGIITNIEKDFYGKFTNLEGKNILCIGFSENEIDHLVAKYQPSAITTITNWTDHVDANINKYPLIIGDITKRIDLTDNSFDAILTLSVLEHLSDLEGAFSEMKRLVKDRGELLHMFGPVWSSAYGHHIYENPDDKLLNFSLWQMPAHMHLLCNQEEIVNYYIDMGYPQSAGISALHWFFETKIINRFFYDDYLKIFNRNHFLIDKMECMYNFLPHEHIERLQYKFPGKKDFSTYGSKIKIVVMK